MARFPNEFLIFPPRVSPPACDLFDQSREPGEFYIGRFVRSVVNFSTTPNFCSTGMVEGRVPVRHRETDTPGIEKRRMEREEEIIFNTRCFRDTFETHTTR